MVAGGDRSGTQTANEGERFALERFTWTAPDRLAVTGTFTALRTPPAAEPALVVRGAGGWRHLPVVGEDGARPPRAGQPWHATFAWEEAPMPFDVAQLAFGDELYVRLPEPAAGGEAQAARVLDVVRAGDAAGAAAESAVSEPVEQLRMETELVALREAVGEARAMANRTAEELARARADLEAERARRTDDAERFQQSLAQVREHAERAIAEAQAAASGQVQALDDARADAARFEASAGELREQLESVAAERAELEAEAERLRAQAAALEELHARAREARGGARQVLERLDVMVETLDAHTET